ncbi:MAG: hypothetical protein EZS28_054555, partial [Streblomastix strix]
IANSLFGPIASERLRDVSGMNELDKKQNGHTIMRFVELDFSQCSIPFTVQLRGNDLIAGLHTLVSLGIALPALPKYIIEIQGY